MKQLFWWSPESPDNPDAPLGTILSHRWVQTFVFELPPLKRAELETSLRFKVQATLPVNAENYAFHTQLFRQGKKTCGAAFLASENVKELLPSPSKSLRVGVPLFLPKTPAPKVLLFVSTPEGLVSHYYEAGLLKTSFAPIAPSDQEVRSRILAKCPDADILALAPDPRYPVPADLVGKEATEALRAKLFEAFPSWDTPPRRRLPQILSSLLLAAGLLLCLGALRDSWSAREDRNAAWSAWLKKNESLATAPNSKDKSAALIKAMGTPVPELFAHLAEAWGHDTRIIDLEWTQEKLTLTATSPSALASLRRLTADPWFRAIRVDDIRTQKDGSDIFTIEGGLSIDS